MSVYDVMIIILAVFTVAVIGIVGNTILVQIENSTNSSGTFTNQSLQHLQQGIDAVRVFDTIMPFILVGLLIGAITLAFFIPTHPILIIPAIFMMTIIVFVAAQISNAYDLIVRNPTLVSEANNWSASANIMGNLPLVAVVLSITIMIAMFASRRNQGVAA